MENNHSAFITFRPHPSDAQLFEDFLIIFLPLLKKRITNYVYVVEKDNTPEKHFHCVINHKSFTETAKVRQKLKCKALLQFEKFLRIDTETNLNVAHQTHFIGNEDKIKNTLYYVGYCYKEDNVSRRDTNLPASYIQEALEYHNTMKRCETNEIEQDVKYIKPNNVHRYINEFRKWEGDDFTWVNLHHRMILQGYSFIQLSSKQFNYAISEIKRKLLEEDSRDVAVIDNHRFDFKKGEEFEIMHEEIQDDIKKLLELAGVHEKNLSMTTQQLLKYTF